MPEKSQVSIVSEVLPYKTNWALNSSNTRETSDLVNTAHMAFNKFFTKGF